MRDIFLKELNKIDRSGIDRVAAYLESGDFFTAPASTRFHNSTMGGLCRHSLSVYHCMIDLCLKYDSEHTIPVSSIAICGLLHDVCKIGVYYLEDKNVKINGRWETKQVYVMHDDLPLGHGEKSVIVLQDYLLLSPDEQLAIRWHMGPWDAESWRERRALGEAMSECRLLKFLMLADELSTWLYEVKK